MNETEIKPYRFRVGDWARVEATGRPVIVRAVGGARCMVEYSEGLMEDFDMDDLRYVFKH